MPVKNRKCVECSYAEVLGKYTRATRTDPAEYPEFVGCLYSDSDINQGDLNPEANECLAEICDYFSEVL